MSTLQPASLGSSQRRIPTVIPIHRILGMLAVCFVVASIQYLGIAPVRWRLTAVFAVISTSYAVATFVVSRRLRDSARLPFVTDRFAELDILLFGYALYLTGGHESPLWILMVIRAADHLNTGYRRVLGYAHLSTVTYLAVLLWQIFVESATPPWAVESVKLFLIYGVNLYICLTAQTFDRMRHKVRDAKRAAEQASRAKSEFLANMSHELRTPLNAIIGYAELLRESASDLSGAEADQDLERIESAGKHLLELVNQVLDLSKVESGKMQLTRERFQPLDIVKDVVSYMEPAARQRRNRLLLEADTPLPVVDSDAIKFRQSLLNLVSNACKFTEAGDVTVRVASSDPGWIAISVTDTGIGIDPSHMQKLFEPFVQADPSVTRKYGGTGLGLAISHKFCTMMGGDLSAESNPGSGSTFTMRIPSSAPAS